MGRGVVPVSYKDTITVGELISQLSEIDPNTPVLFSHYDSEWGETYLHPYHGLDVREVTYSDHDLITGDRFGIWDFGGDIDAVVF